MPDAPTPSIMEQIVSLCKRRGVHLPCQRNLRRYPRLLGLWPAGRFAEKQYSRLVVAQYGGVPADRT